MCATSNSLFCNMFISIWTCSHLFTKAVTCFMQLFAYKVQVWSIVFVYCFFLLFFLLFLFSHHYYLQDKVFNSSFIWCCQSCCSLGLLEETKFVSLCIRAEMWSIIFFHLLTILSVSLTFYILSWEYKGCILVSAAKKTNLWTIYSKTYYIINAIS